VTAGENVASDFRLLYFPLIVCRDAGKEFSAHRYRWAPHGLSTECCAHVVGTAGILSDNTSEGVLVFGREVRDGVNLSRRQVAAGPSNLSKQLRNDGVALSIPTMLHPSSEPRVVKILSIELWCLATSTHLNLNPLH